MAAVSLREVAERAGVARATASTVLSGRAAEARISSDTQERVRRAASELGYTPNRLAQGLVGGRTHAVGVLLGPLRDPFNVALLDAIAYAARRARLDLLLDLGASRDEGAGMLGAWPVDGALVWALPWQTLADVAGPRAGDLPVVYLGHGRDDLSDWVAYDRAGGTRQLLQHLRARGYGRVAFLHPPGGYGDIRYAEYAAVCREWGGEPWRLDLDALAPAAAAGPRADLRRAGVEAGLLLAARPTPERPDAVICPSDLVAVGVYHGLRRAGVDVPGEMAVAGFDGTDEGAHLDRPLTTVAAPLAPLADAALEILGRRLALGGGPASSLLLPPQHVLLPASLRVGGTS